MKNINASNIIIQPVDNNIESELQYIDCDDYGIITMHIHKWFDELPPWKSESVFGKEGFGDGASDTLKDVLDVIDHINKHYPLENRNYYLCGYSLAGLFALWASYNSDVFKGIAAVSPSVWYPGWLDYVKSNHIQCHNVYLSLGDKEEKTKNKMHFAGPNIRELNDYLKDKVNVILEWNEGDHFKEPDKRCAKGINWLLNNC